MQEKSARAQFAMRVSASAHDIALTVQPAQMALVRSTIEQTKAQLTSANVDEKIEHTITVEMRSNEKPPTAFGAKCSAEAQDVKMTSASNTNDLNFQSSSTSKVGEAPSLLPECMHPTSSDFSNSVMIRSAYNTTTSMHREHTTSTTTSCTLSAASSTGKKFDDVFKCDAEDEPEMDDWCKDAYEEFCSLPNVAGEDSELQSKLHFTDGDPEFNVVSEETQMQFKLHSTDGNTELSVEHTQKHSAEFHEKVELVIKSCTMFFTLTSPTYQVQQRTFLHLLQRHAQNDVNFNDFLRQMIVMFQGIKCEQAQQIVHELFIIQDILAFSTSISFTMLHNDVIHTSAEANNEANTLSKKNTPLKNDECKRSGYKTPDNLQEEDLCIDSPDLMSGQQSIFSFTPRSHDISPHDRFNIYSPPTDHLQVYSPPQDRPAFSASFLLQTQSAKSTTCFKFVKNDLPQKNLCKQTAPPAYVHCKFCGKVFKKNGINRHLNTCKNREVHDLQLHNEPKILCVCCRNFFEHDMFQQHYLECSGQHKI